EYHMKRLLTMCAAVGASLLATSFALAADPGPAPPDPLQPREQTTHSSSLNAYFVNAEQKQSEAKHEEKATKEVTPASASCACESKSSEAPSCGSESPSCGSETPSCGSGCGCDDNWCDLGLDKHWPFCCCCKPGDPCTLEKHLTPCCKD